VSKAWAKGSTRQWRKIRAAVLEHNRIHYGGQCRARVRGVCTKVAEHAHHTRGREITGDDLRHIEGVCAPCNLHIGNPVTHPYNCPQCADVQWVRVGPLDPKPTPFTDW
jgi:hypothetical protein